MYTFKYITILSIITQLYLNNYTLAGQNILYFVLAVYYCRLNENRKFCKLIFKQIFPNVLNLCKQIVLQISDMWTMRERL